MDVYTKTTLDSLEENKILDFFFFFKQKTAYEITT